MYGIFKKAFFCLRITTLQTVVNLHYSLTLVQVAFNILHFQREWFTNGLSVLCSPQKNHPHLSLPEIMKKFDSTIFGR